MKSSFFPGRVIMYASSSRRFASFCQWSPGIFVYSEPLRCTTSSCDNGMMKCSLYSYIIANVSWS